MKQKVQLLLLCVSVALAAAGQSSPGSPARPASTVTQQAPNNKPATQSPSGSQQELKSVLAEMNKQSATFKSAQADFEWDQYQKVVEEHDIQKGQIYFRRAANGRTDAAVKVVSPEPKQVIFKDGKLDLYQPKIDQVTEYSAGNNRAEVESFMSLGFGGSGDELVKNFDVKFAGWETVDAVKTAKLDLIPKSEKMKASVNRVLLWIDPERNVSLRQQFFEPSGDYRLTHYSNIRMNSRISDDVFRLKTTGKTQVVKP